VALALVVAPACSSSASAIGYVPPAGCSTPDSLQSNCPTHGRWSHLVQCPTAIAADRWSKADCTAPFTYMEPNPNYDYACCADPAFADAGAD
jgi:hypothetical protein